MQQLLFFLFLFLYIYGRVDTSVQYAVSIFFISNGKTVVRYTHCDGRQHSTRAELIYRSTVGGNFVFLTMKKRSV